jgi:outer membrane lipoprotein LolB
MRRAVLLVFYCSLAGCATTRLQPTPAAAGWEQRSGALQHARNWQLDGRAAVAVGTQGWQASLNWRQHDEESEVHLAGPFGVGAIVMRRTPQGLSLNGAPPSDAVLAQLQQKLGFDLPLDNLRYWLLGVADPHAAFELTRNSQDRAATLIQEGWHIEVDRYLPSNGDLLPAHVVLSRDGVRVRIVIDHWTLAP